MFLSGQVAGSLLHFILGCILAASVSFKKTYLCDSYASAWRQVLLG